MAKRPAFQFYKGDYTRSEAASCSLAAQGFWLRLLILMDDSDECGYLIRNGGPLPMASVARLTGATTDEAIHLLKELQDANVYSTDARGVIFSRRMVRDEIKRQADAERKEQERQNKQPRVSVQPLSSECPNDVAVSVRGLSEEEVEEEREVFVTLSVQSTLDASCDLIYQAYPRKVAPARAAKAIRRAIQWQMSNAHCAEEDAAQYILEAVHEFARSPAGKKGEYVPYPATWFNGHSFRDDRSEWYRSGNGQVSKAQSRDSDNIANIAAGFGFTRQQPSPGDSDLQRPDKRTDDDLVERIAEYIDGSRD